MPKTRRVLVHNNGPALWPEHRSEDAINDLFAITPDTIIATTWQGRSSPLSGGIFKREWWHGRNRYDPSSPLVMSAKSSRFISYDTSEGGSDVSDFTAYVVGDLLPDYRLAIRFVHESRLEFPDLTDNIVEAATAWNTDDRLSGIIIESKSTGTSAVQTLRSTAPREVADVLVPYWPGGSKEERAARASAWCKAGMVLLPYPSISLPWLASFESQLFDIPFSAYDDMADAFAALVIYLEHFLEHGYHSRVRQEQT